ncbi:molybdopterin guanine dinucleotide biosynthesis accessory protein MobB [Tepidamorphus gemmatus]|uniref:Molybdopterin guanine dinucleotide biosynthesis accessory protein MobB n=1 Tax=Tepidamorphus gemmatus TaxID=747076 RepID=A0A4V2V018_9HYPH|nr:molybdopterin-guanine dinucleotide biosynthesis protein B [Tepidamorphus gemmatus]TCT13549.1 molybdopterin guanine dinucleotide biosynthesis accessory protein MobB [Tepidamorphus gemmatus]
MTPVFGVTGWKNSGKTTLVTRLIAEFVGRGLRVNSVKHAHHAFDIDVPGTDSFRHREAGATEVALISGTRWALMHELREDAEPRLEDIVARMAPADLLLIEGYKRERHPKIECRRQAGRKATPLSAEDPTIVAIAADFPVDGGGLPVFHLDDVAGIAGFIAGHLGLAAALAGDPIRTGQVGGPQG